MIQFTTILAGVQFRPASAKSVVKFLKTDQVLGLERDADNPYDINAIKVIDPDSLEFIGFVAKRDAADVAPYMDNGVATTVKVAHNGGPKEVHLVIEVASDELVQPIAELPSHTPKSLGELDDEVPF